MVGCNRLSISDLMGAPSPIDQQPVDVQLYLRGNVLIQASRFGEKNETIDYKQMVESLTRKVDDLLDEERRNSEFWDKSREVSIKIQNLSKLHWRKRKNLQQALDYLESQTRLPNDIAGDIIIARRELDEAVINSRIKNCVEVTYYNVLTKEFRQETQKWHLLPDYPQIPFAKLQLLEDIIFGRLTHDDCLRLNDACDRNHSVKPGFFDDYDYCYIIKSGLTLEDLLALKAFSLER